MNMMRKLNITALVLLLTASIGYAQAFWGRTSERYAHKKLDASQTETKHRIKAWRGETVNAQIVLQNRDSDEALYTFSLGTLRNKNKESLKLRLAEMGYVDEVLADTFSNCGTHELEKHGRYPMADRLVLKDYLLLPRGEQRGLWFSLQPEQTAKPGIYTGEVQLRRAGKLIKKLSLELEVLPHVLPDAREWSFHLDFWQNPYSVARYHKVELWSDKHFDLMRPLMQRLAASGQKVITATLIDRPWNGQTEDAFGSMIKWTKHRDGSWSYDYSIFDKWVRFMMSCGIDREITCFSMIPWQLSFAYYDEATGEQKHWESKPGEALYTERWSHFLKSFESHLKQQSWIDRTTIAMDERSLEQMQEAIRLIKTNSPSIKISMAGNYHPEIEQDLYDYCVDFMSKETYTPEVLVRRKKEGKISTYYTCCSSAILNTFTFSPLAEAELIPWYALKKGYDGYLRWAYNSWTIDPVYDSRFRAWSSGDTYIVYPNNYPSLRWIKLQEGIQQFEKYRLLQRNAKSKARLDALDKLAQKVDLSRIAEVDKLTEELKRELNSY